MKHAIISDIHGNIHALEAVLTDAAAQGADSYLCIGDYASSFPFGNEVTNTLRGLKNATIIRGNGEGYFINLLGKDPATLTAEQFKPVYWGYKHLSPENLHFLTTLPETAEITDNGITIHLAHARDLFFRTPQIPLFRSHSPEFLQLIDAPGYTRTHLLTQAKADLLSVPAAVAEIKKMPEGVYLSGHNHIQFYMNHENRVFINPGSCGEPLDGDARASYTILSVNPTGEYSIDERRISYDQLAAATALHTAGYHAYAPIWSDIMEAELCTGRDFFYPLAAHVFETAGKMGEASYPVSNAAWEEAIRTRNTTLPSFCCHPRHTPDLPPTPPTAG